MDQELERERFANAKIEEPNVLLPKAMLKPYGDPLNDLCYMKIFDDTQKAQEIAETDASGTKLERKVYRIRNKELVKILENDFEGMIEIQRVSKATIGILANVESNLHCHSYLDLVGNIEQVKKAEELILAKVLKTYSSLIFPIILMPPTIYWDQLIIPLHKIVHVLGTSGSNLLWIEMESGSWIKIEPGPYPDGLEWARLVKIYGPRREHVKKAILLILSVIFESDELSATDALNELLHQLKEPGSGKLNDREKSIRSKIKRKLGKKNQHDYKEAYRNQIFRSKNSFDEESRSKQEEGESENEKTRNEFKAYRRGQTFIRVKKSGGEKSKGSKQTEGESEEKKKTHEFKEPTWSQTFGYMKLSSELEKRQEDVDREADPVKSEDEREDDESKEKM